MRARAKSLARGAFRLRRPSGDLAQLVHDSLIDAHATAADHYLRFEHDDVTVHVHVAATPDHTELCGRTEPANERITVLQSVRVEPPLRSVVTSPGRFSFSNVSHGLVRMRIDGPEKATIWSDWFRI